MIENGKVDFVMSGARNAIARGFDELTEHVNAIEKALDENPGLAIDLARTITEMTCRRILVECNVQYRDDADLPALFRQVRHSVRMLPPDASSEAGIRRSIDQALNGLHTAMQGISALRNQAGFASHGHPYGPPRMERLQALLAVTSADAIVGFLYDAHTYDRTVSCDGTVPSYGENQEYNDFIDESYGAVEIFDSVFHASAILFQMEPTTYNIHLNEFSGHDTGTEETNI